jgi:tetratricopeptide (TPR) repeat protein
VRFRNSLVHKASYEGLPYRRRRELHGKIADSIEHSGGGADLLSVHYFAAGRWPEAWENSRAAGDRAKSIHANIEAATLYERAIESARWMGSVPEGDRAEILESLGDVHDLAGLYDESTAAYQRARKLLAGSPLDEGRLALKQAYLRERSGDLTQALRWIRRGHKALERLDDDEAASIRARLTVWYAVIRAYQGRLEDALAWAERAIEEASKALEIYEEIEDLRGIGTSSNNLGGYAYFAGEWDDACSHYERAEEVQNRMGNPVDAAIASGNIAEILSDQGHIHSPEPRLQDAHRIFAASGDPFGIAFTERLLAVGASRRQEFDKADQLFASASAGFDELGMVDEVFHTDLSRAESLLVRGDTEAALSRLDEMAATPDPTSELADFMSTLNRLRSEALMLTGDLAGARADLDQAEAAAREQGSDYELAMILTTQDRLDGLEETASRPEVTDERDRILEHLGVVRIPELEALQTPGRATWVALP